MTEWYLDPGKKYASAETRRDLIVRCRSQRTRTVSPSLDAPCKWHPGTVRNPKTQQPFLPHQAWEFICDVLELEIPIEVITLEKPPNKRGYVIKAPGQDGQVIYIKLHFGNSMVFGRSFHVSEFDHQERSICTTQ